MVYHQNNKSHKTLILMSCLLLLSCDGKQNISSSSPSQETKSPNHSDYGKLIIGEWDCLNNEKEYRLLVSSTKHFGPDGEFKSTNFLVNKISAGVSVTTGTYVVEDNELIQRSIDEYTKKMVNYVYTIDQLTNHSLKLSDKFDENSCTRKSKIKGVRTL